MRQVTPEFLAQKLPELLDLAQNEAILVMREGKPSVLVLGIERHENHDAEDWGYMTDPEFWKMIRERRKETKFISWEEAKARLLEAEEAERRAVDAK